MSVSAPPSRPPPSSGNDRLAAIAALIASVLLLVIGERFGLDRALCAAWPPRAVGFGYGVIYLAAVGGYTFAWKRYAGHDAKGMFALGVGTYAIATCAVPFLSSDPLMYAAIGRALATGSSASTPLVNALGANDPFIVVLPEAWRSGTSAYGPMWNVMAALIGGETGDALRFALQLHQIAAGLAMLLAAWVISRAFGRTAFALVALCPLAIIEGPLGAHNDALLAPLVALALLLWLRGRSLVVLLVLALGLAIKASAAIFLFPVALAMLLAKIALRHRRWLAIVVAIGGIAGLAILPMLRDGPLDAVSRLVERPDVPFDHCTRSLECLPRVLFRFVLHMPTAAWVTGLVFRAVSVVWLCFVAFQAAGAEDRRAAARWIALGLFLYFLVLHGWAQSWYVLPLLPSLPLFAEDRFGPGIRLYTLTAIVYYALVLPMSCLQDQVVIAVSDLIEASITFFPPVVLLVRAWRR